jgi:hypothetical protein
MTTRKTRIRYSAALVIRASPAIIEQIHAAARKRNTRPSEWLRNAVALALAIERGDVEDAS